jgi:hypothetical protein
MICLAANSAWAIKFYKGQGGTVSSIDEGAFSACSKIYYRNEAKSELPKEHQTAFVKASLKGEVINELKAVSDLVKNSSGACTYGSDGEKF